MQSKQDLLHLVYPTTKERGDPEGLICPVPCLHNNNTAVDHPGVNPWESCVQSQNSELSFTVVLFKSVYEKNNKDIEMDFF